MRRVVVAVQVAALACLAACSDPKAANETNFRKVLEPIAADAFCRQLGVEPMTTSATGNPPVWPLVIRKKPSLVFGSEEAQMLLGAGMQLGMLTRVESKAPARRIGSDGPLAPEELVTYAVTSKGEPYFRPVMGETVSHQMKPFPATCAAKGELVDVVRWTDPADMFGRTVTQVTYTYRGSDPIYPASPADLTALRTPKEETVALVRSSDGWHPVDR